MSHEKIRSLFSSAVQSVVSSIANYAVNPEKDLTRCKKFPADKLITFLVSEGSSSTRNELLDFFGMDAGKPTDSAFNQQRAKLKPEAVKAVFHKFNQSVDTLNEPQNTAIWQLTVPPQLTSAALNSLRLNILWNRVILQKGFTASTSMPFMIWSKTHILLWSSFFVTLMAKNIILMKLYHIAYADIRA